MMFVEGVTQRVPLIEQEVFTLPEHVHVFVGFV